LFLFFFFLSLSFFLSSFPFLFLFTGRCFEFGIDDFHDPTNNPQPQQHGSQGEYKKRKIENGIKPERRLPSHSI